MHEITQAYIKQWKEELLNGKHLRMIDFFHKHYSYFDIVHILKEDGLTEYLENGSIRYGLFNPNDKFKLKVFLASHGQKH